MTSRPCAGLSAALAAVVTSCALLGLAGGVAVQPGLRLQAPVVAGSQDARAHLQPADIPDEKDSAANVLPESIALLAEQEAVRSRQHGRGSVAGHLADHWRSAVGLAALSTVATGAFCFGLPGKLAVGARGPPSTWSPGQRQWLSVSAAQVMLIAGTLSFIMIEFPGHARREGLHMWQIGAVFGALPLGHSMALRLYPLLARFSSDAALCGGAGMLRAALLVLFANSRQFGMLVFYRFLLGATCSLAHTASLAFLHSHWLDPAELTEIMAYEDNALNLGAVFGCSIGAVFFMYGFEVPFWVAAAFNVLLGVLMFRSLRTPVAACGGPKSPDISSEGGVGLTDCLVRAPKRAGHGGSCSDGGDSGVGSPGTTSASEPGHSTESASPGQTPARRQGAPGRASRRGAGDAAKGMDPVAWITLVAAVASVLAASLAMTFWEPLLSLHLRGRFPDTFATPLDVGVVWASLHVVQLLLNIVAGRAVRDSDAGMQWALAGAGWLMLAGSFELTARASGSMFFGGLALFTCAIVAVWTPSMPCLLQAAAPLGRTRVERCVPEVWVAAYSLGEAVGPVIAAAGAGAIGIAAASHMSALLSAGFLGLLLLCSVPQLTAKWIRTVLLDPGPKPLGLDVSM